MSSAINHRKRSHRSEALKGSMYRAAGTRAYLRSENTAKKSFWAELIFKGLGTKNIDHVRANLFSRKKVEEPLE